jgi:phage repressor protein C with HTH and peptisase S24 domain
MYSNKINDWSITMGRGNLKPHEEKLRLIIASNIRRLLDENNLKAIDLRRGTGISQSSISEYLNAKATPNLGKVQKIADYFGVPKSEIDPSLLPDWTESSDYSSPVIAETVETMKQLEEPRQKVVLDTASSQLEEQQNENIVQLKESKKEIEYETLYVHGLESAGSGEWQENDLDIEVQIPTSEIPEAFDDLAMVVGDSMRPKLHNADILFIKFTKQIEIGQIGVFRTSRGNFVKKFKASYLESLNPDYDDIYFSEDEECEAIGVVIDYYRK